MSKSDFDIDRRLTFVSAAPEGWFRLAELVRRGGARTTPQATIVAHELIRAGAVEERFEPRMCANGEPSAVTSNRRKEFRLRRRLVSV